MDFDVMTVVVLAVTFLVAGVVIKLVIGSFSGKKQGPSGVQTQAECYGCGWKGIVSQYNKKCPNCGDSLIS
ncbi:hypothetical protein ACFL2Q_10635 [Thermodesulfobacteriota bacterium]